MLLVGFSIGLAHWSISFRLLHFYTLGNNTTQSCSKILDLTKFSDFFTYSWVIWENMLSISILISSSKAETALPPWDKVRWPFFHFSIAWSDQDGKFIEMRPFFVPTSYRWRFFLSILFQRIKSVPLMNSKLVNLVVSIKFYVSHWQLKMAWHRFDSYILATSVREMKFKMSEMLWSFLYVLVIF